MPEVVVSLPTLHPGQVGIFKSRAKYNQVRCGRRYGKTKMMVVLAASAAAKGLKVGLFTPEHKQLNEPYVELLSVLLPVKASANRNDGTIRTVTGGLIDFWSLDDNELAGRGREYDLVMIDEAAFTKNSQMVGIWQRSIKPTMATRPNATVWVFSTPNGNDPENFFYKLYTDKSLGFQDHYAPSSDSPYVTPEFLEEERTRTHPLVFRQEYLAEFVDFSGEAFFRPEYLLGDGGVPVEYPDHCDVVFAIIDSAVKAGREHDGTAVSYWAHSTFSRPALVCLDWDVISVDGAMLEAWIPNVFRRCEDLAAQCKARMGSAGAWIEDAQSGSILLQQCANRRLPAKALPADLTAAGKDGRALNVSGIVYQGHVKFSRHAYEKTTSFKGQERNHMWAQLMGFRIGDKAAATRADDLLDCFTYAIAIALGNADGIG
jgi:hypothetical protein